MTENESGAADPGRGLPDRGSQGTGPDGMIVQDKIIVEIESVEPIASRARKGKSAIGQHAPGLLIDFNVAFIKEGISNSAGTAFAGAWAPGNG